MNGDDVVQQKEIGDIIDDARDKECAKNCKAHPTVVQGMIKSLRLNEQSIKWHKWHLAIAVLVLLSVWLKGNAADTMVTVLSALVKTAFGSP